LDPLLDRLEREGRALVGFDLDLDFDSPAPAMSARPVRRTSAATASAPSGTRARPLVQDSPSVADVPAPANRHVIRPASPTLDAAQLLGLVRLRLEAVAWPGAVTALRIAIEPTAARHEQLSLFAAKPKRDVRAAARAFARLRATFGDGVVVRARLTEGHLPEARFAWDAITSLEEPKKTNVESAANPLRDLQPVRRTLVRKLFTKPVPLPPRPPQEPDGCLLRGLDHGPVSRFVGPYVISGAWWRTEVHREYYVAEMRNGDFLWVYYDRPRRRWFLQGEVA
jgi:protein ImuB